MTQLSLFDANHNVVDHSGDVETPPKETPTPSAVSPSPLSPPPGSTVPPTSLYASTIVDYVAPDSPSTVSTMPSRGNSLLRPPWGYMNRNASVPRTRIVPPGDTTIVDHPSMNWPRFGRRSSLDWPVDWPETNYRPEVQVVDNPVSLRSPSNNAARGRISPYSAERSPPFIAPTGTDSVISPVYPLNPPISPVYRGPRQHDRPAIPRPPLYSNFRDNKVRYRNPPLRDDKALRFWDKVTYVEPSDQETDTYTDDCSSSTSRFQSARKGFEAGPPENSPYSQSEGNVPLRKVTSDQLLSIPSSLISLGGHLLTLHKLLRCGRQMADWDVTSNPIDFTFYWNNYRRERLPTSIASLPATQPPLKVMQLTFEKEVYPHTHTVWAAPGPESYVTIGDVLLGIHRACSGWISLEQWHNLDTESGDRYQMEYARRVKMMAWKGKAPGQLSTPLKWSDTLGGRVYFGGLVQNEYQNMHGLITWTVRLD